MIAENTGTCSASAQADAVGELLDIRLFRPILRGLSRPKGQLHGKVMAMILTSSKFFMALAMCGAAVLAVPSQALAEVKIGIVDLQKVLKTTVAGKAAQKKFDDLRKAKQGQLEAREKDLGKREKELIGGRQEIETALQATGGKPTDELKAKVIALQEKGRKFEQDVLEHEKKKREIVDELAKKESDLLKPIEDTIKAKVDAIAKERSLSIVLNRQVAIYVAEALDITAEVIKRCDTP